MANNYAIIIGINFYQRHPERRLKYAVKDAQLMHNFLCNYAQFPRNNIILCLGDELHRDSEHYPLCSNILGLLTQDLHPECIGKVDRFWFFFAGHGISKNGRDYLITSDSLIKDTDLRIALPLDEIIACLRQHRDAEIVLILDSCRQIVGSRDFGDSVGEETIKLAQNRGITTIFSCDYGQFSHELDNQKNGSFTYSLVEGLKQYTLPVQLEKFLQKNVHKLNIKDGKSSSQTPIIRVESASKAHYPLLPECATEADIDEMIRLATNEELDNSFEKARNLWWKVIETSRSEKLVMRGRKALERLEEKNNQVTANLPIVDGENQKNKKLVRLKPINTPIKDFIDVNPDDWAKKQRVGSQSLWDKIISFIFDEKDL
ncbi:MAG: caspase family protein [Symploca sp. SIO2C1]|nr:caspase family protein [Symploca sp. SIO2C1]